MGSRLCSTGSRCRGGRWRWGRCGTRPGTTSPCTSEPPMPCAWNFSARWNLSKTMRITTPAGNRSCSTCGTRAHPRRDSETERMIRAGIDIGGAFTDLLLVGDDGGAVAGETLTTPEDPTLAVETELRQALQATGARSGERGMLVHGTTLVTNAIIERRGPPTALLATAGFRDAVEIGREHRFDLYDLNLEFPKPLVPRHLRF